MQTRKVMEDELTRSIQTRRKSGKRALMSSLLFIAGVIGFAIYEAVQNVWIAYMGGIIMIASYGAFSISDILESFKANREADMNEMKVASDMRALTDEEEHRRAIAPFLEYAEEPKEKEE